MFVEDEINFVKSQIEHHKRTITFHEKRNDPIKANRHRGILRRFEELLPKMESAPQGQVAANVNVAEIKKIGSRFGDLSDLPDELKSQLVSVQFDALEEQIIDVVTDHLNQIASIDEILVALWRSHGDLHQREAIANKIYRMTRKELLYSVPARKGVYSTVEVEDSDVEEGETEASQ